MSEHKFIKAYNDLMGNLYEIMDDGLHSLADGLEKAKVKTHALGFFTQEEIHKVADYLKRDIEGAAQSLRGEKTDNLSEWLKFDIQLIENFALDAFKDVADKTSVELAKFNFNHEQNLHYAGEITSPGTLNCVDCKKAIAFKSTSEIPFCPTCGGRAFVRH